MSRVINLILLACLMMTTASLTFGQGENSVDPDGDDHSHEHRTVEGVDQEEVEKLALRNTRFAMNLYTFVRERTKSSFFFSPFSISSMLAMANLGTGGNTQEEIARVLELHDLEDAHDVFRQTLELILTHNDHFTILIANRLFARTDFNFKASYNDEATRYYQAGLEELDFAGDPDGSRKQINNWVLEQTHQKIPDLLQQGTVNSMTYMVLVNAMYFHSEWQYTFPIRKTSQKNFTMATDEVTQVDMMHQSGMFPYLLLRDFHCSILELPYLGEHMSMFVLLPTSAEYSRIMERHLTGDRLVNLLKMERPMTQVDVFLPRFNVTVDMNLKAFLQKMGIHDLFDPLAANLTGLTDDVRLAITEVFHKSYLNVYENGTEASSATGMVAVATAAEVPSPVVFNADHPFAFIIRENPTGTILFAGRYMGPDQNQDKFGVFAENLASEPKVGSSIGGASSVNISRGVIAAALMVLPMVMRR